MKKLTLLALLATVCLAGQAQKSQLTFDLSAAYQPDDYFFPALPQMGLSPRDNFDLSPVFEAQLGLRHPIGRSPWFYQVELLAHYTQNYYENQILLRPAEVDPLFGFVQQTSNGKVLIKMWERYTSAGLTAGIGYELMSRNRKTSLALPIGIKSYYTFSRKKKVKFDENTQKSTISRYGGRSDSFGDWLYYGAYFSPSFEFSLSKKRTPWRFAVFAEASMLWDDIEIERPLFLFGGGIGLRYQIK